MRRICEDTRAETARRREAVSLDAIRSKAIATAPTRAFGQALMQAAESGYGLVAEIKRASPSAGVIRADFDPADLARAYKNGGATCLSVLTESHYFLGDRAHLKIARAAVDLPVLRKDFILDPWQVYESRVLGADCILLIMAALSDEEAVELERIARSLGMDVLVEVHDRAELDRALGLQTKLLGINNRDLRTLRTDLSTCQKLAPLAPPDRFLIAESGIHTHHDIRALADLSVRCFLVGESLLRQADVTAATRALLGA